MEEDCANPGISGLRSILEGDVDGGGVAGPSRSMLATFFDDIVHGQDFFVPFVFRMSVRLIASLALVAINRAAPWP